MAKDMDEFLGSAAPEPEPVAEPVVEAVQPEPAAEPDPKPEPVAETAPADAPPGGEDEAEMPADVAALRSAVMDERRKRRDYKGERDRMAGELAAMKAQLEAAVKPPPPPPTPEPVVERAAPQPIPNPIEDLQGYHNYIEMKRISDKLDMSENMLRGEIKDDTDVDARVASFKRLADANPALQAELLRQRHPYRFAYDYVKRTEAMAEIGTDPAAYRTKLEADIRAKIEAEMTASIGVTQPRAAPDVVLPTSLGTARSAAPRTQSVPDPPEFEDIFRPRKRA